MLMIYALFPHFPSPPHRVHTSVNNFILGKKFRKMIYVVLGML